jgi:flagellar protein FlaI
VAKITDVKDKVVSLTSGGQLHLFSGRRRGKTAKASPPQEAVTVQVEKAAVGAAQVPSSFKEVTSLIEPYAYAAITHDPKTGGMLYYVIEPTLLDEDKALYKKIREILVEELDVDVRKIGSREEAQKVLRFKVESIVKQYKIRIEAEVLDKLMYYVTRDFIYNGKIEPLMRDHMIEDISCDGPGVPIYVWHRRYESIPTNIIFEEAKELDNFVVKLAYVSGKHISIASPMVDGGLLDGSRVQLTYGKEVTRNGSTFSIRRFRADPMTVSDLISFNTLTSEMAAYFWYTMEKKACTLISGGTASGKTTLLNCISMFILPDDKIVTIEDTPELNIPHKNWISSIARVGFGSGGSSAEISLFDLLKAAMRQRPDYIIVGEVRGEEAFTLFQAMATGHGGLSSIHGDSVTASIRRLESAPLNIPRTLLPTLNLIGLQARLRIGDRPVRRLTHLAEVLGIDASSGELDLNDVFRWDPKTDTYTYSGRSHTIERLAERGGQPLERVQEELRHRRTVLDYMVKKNIRRYQDVGAMIRDYYADPIKVHERARLGLLGE